MDWVDKPQNYKGLYGTFAKLPLEQFSTKNSKTWLGSFSFNLINIINSSQSSHVSAIGYGKSF